MQKRNKKIIPILILLCCSLVGCSNTKNIDDLKSIEIESETIEIIDMEKKIEPETKNRNKEPIEIEITESIEDTSNIEIEKDLSLEVMIWTIEDVLMYNLNKEVINNIKAGTPLLTIIEDDDSYFKIEYEGIEGYIDSNKCLVNLPDVMQPEVRYDITNSYSSIYKIHGNSIENVTGQKLYPYVKIEENEYLVPILYPIVKNLYAAEEEALEKGYTLKIYDTYRPYPVSKYIYNETSNFLKYNPIMKEYMTEEINGETYTQANFLAQSVSNHNYGVALDLTLENVITGEELEMQSAMHELSTKSILSLNNSNAEILKDIMIKNGFTGLKSEWWHYQIKEYKQSYGEFQIEPYKYTEEKTQGKKLNAYDAQKFLAGQAAPTSVATNKYWEEQPVEEVSEPETVENVVINEEPVASTEIVQANVDETGHYNASGDISDFASYPMNKVDFSNNANLIALYKIIILF